MNDVYMEAVVKTALYADDITLVLQNNNNNNVHLACTQ